MKKLIGNFLPTSFKKTIRRFIFKFKNPFAYLGDAVEIDSSVTLGKGCSINAYSLVKNAEIGRYSYCSRNTTLMNVKIGSFCSIGPGCQIGLGSHPSHFVSTSPIFYSTFGQLNGEIWTDKDHYKEFNEVIIENNVWLGANVVILDGVRIGEGSVCAAGSVISKDVPPYAIVGGVPAKVIKYRFDFDSISQLLQLNLFEREEDWLKKHLVGSITPDRLLSDNEIIKILKQEAVSQTLFQESANLRVFK